MKEDLEVLPVARVNEVPVDLQEHLGAKEIRVIGDATESRAAMEKQDLVEKMARTAAQLSNISFAKPRFPLRKTTKRL